MIICNTRHFENGIFYNVISVVILFEKRAAEDEVFLLNARGRSGFLCGKVQQTTLGVQCAIKTPASQLARRNGSYEVHGYKHWTRSHLYSIKSCTQPQNPKKYETDDVTLLGS